MPAAVALWALCLLGAACASGGAGGGPGPGGGSRGVGAPATPVVINPAANTFLGAVVALRSRGAGLFGCGPRTHEGQATLDALQALSDAVNSDQPALPTIPKGVSLGMRVFDHCGRPRVAVSQLADMLPELGPGGPPPGPPASAPGLRTVGILDGAGLTRTDADADLEVRHALAAAMVPVAAVDSSHLVQPMQRAQAMVAALQRLEWRRFVVVRGADAYSDDLWQALAQLAGGLRAADLCVDSVETFVPDGPSGPSRTGDNNNGQEVLDVVTDAAVAGLPVVVLLPRGALRPFLDALREALSEADMPPAAPAALMLLLSDLVALEDAPLLPRGATIYSLATSTHGPDAVKVLEALMPGSAPAGDSLSAALRRDALLAAAQPVLGLALALRRSWRDKCPGKASGACPPWAAMSRPEFLSAYFAPLVAATARGERALEPGWEPRWAALLLPPDDLTLYRYLPDDALPGKHSVRAVLRASSVAVAANATGQTAATTVLDPAFQPEEVGVCATRPSAHSAAECERTCLPLHRPSRTAGGRRIESWANYQDNHLQRDANPDHPDSERPEVLESDEQHAAADRRHAGLGDDFLRLAESPQGAYLMLMLPLRRGPSNGETVLDCPAEVGDDAVDVVAVRRVEAFLWALRRLNQQLAREAVAGQAGPGQPLQLGALLADTCSSSLRAMTLAAKLRTPGQDQDGAERVLAVVNALPLPSARLAADILAERNVTSIATAQLLHANASSSSPYQLQVDLPLAHMVEAMVQTLRQLGWSYVSVVRADGEAGVDATADHVRGKDMFVEAAARAGICVALEVTLPRSSSAAQEEAAVGRLLGARAAGARAAVVWGSAAGVRALFRAVTRAIAQGSLRREDVFWLLASPDGDARDVLSEFGNVLAGAAVFSPQRRGVAEFQHFLQQETAAADARGSGPAGGVTGSDHELRWLRRYQEQCGAVGAVCAADEAAAVAGDWAVVQAVQALGAALAELRPCPSDDGSASSEASVEASAQPAAESPWPRGGEVCVADAPPRPLDAALADALRWTPSPRADGPIGAEFRFSPDGAGQLAVDVDNFRRRPAAARSRSLGDVHFQKVGTFLNGKLTSLDGRGPDSGGQGLVAYKDTGEEVRVASLTSQCGGSLGSCHRCRQQRGRPNSALGDWLVVEPPTPPQQQASEPTVYMLATIDVHEPSSNPLQCGQEISPRGVEQLEAFLWAVDQVNSNLSGLRVGAVAVDSCGSAARTSRLVAELLAEQANRVLQAEAEAGDAEPEVPDAAQDGALAGPVVAVLAGGATPVAAPALEAAAALGLPSVAPAARGPAPHRKTHPPYPLLLGPSNSAVAAGVVTLLGRLRWSCAAALYLQDAVDHEETFRQVESLARASNISVRGVPVAASAHSSQAGALAALRGALLQARGGGGRVAVLLLLPAWAVDAALRAAAALEDEGLWVPEDAALLAAGLEGLGGDGLAALLAHSRQTLGALVLRSRAALVLQFERHFRRLSLDANERDPWFAEFWSSVFHCRGSACRDGPGPGQHGLDAYQMQTGPDTANTINAVLAMGHALQTVRRELCPDGSPTGTGASRGARGPCRGMAALGRVKARLLEVAPRMAFVGAGPNAVAFDASGENTNVALEVLNVQMSAHSKAAVAVPVAEVGPSGALTGLDPDSTRAYVGAHREPVDLLSASPPVTCPGSDGAALATAATPTASSEVTGAGRPEPHAKYLMELPGVGAAGQPAPALLVLLAAHGPATSPGRSGKDAFHCGPLDADAVCQLAGAMFAVDRANRNASLLEGQAPKLGMVALDTCGQPGRAYSSLFTLLSHPDRRSVPVAALVLDEAAPPMVGPLLDMQAIARLDDPGHPAALQGSRSGQLAAVHAGPEALSRALLDVAVALQTQSAAHAEPRAAIPGATTAPLGPAPLVVIHGSSAHARALARHLESASLARCPAAAQPQPGPPGATATPPPAAAHHGPGCLSAVLPRPIQASVAGDNSRSGAQYLLSTLAAQSVVILALDSVDDARALLLSAQSAAVPRLVFLVALPGGHAKPLTADGHSVLSLVADATVVPSPAGGRDEALDAAFRDWLQALQELQPTATPPTMPPAWANSIRDSPCDLDSDADGQWSRADMMRAVERVARAVRWAAANASAADSAADPAADSASALPSRVSRFLQAEAAGEATEEPAAVAQVDTFRLWRGDEALGSWSPDGSLALDADLGLLALDELSVAGPGARSRPTLFHNLQSVWAVALLALALLGILATLVIAVFFLSAAAVSKTPISGGAGTSVLGYLILLGLLLLHAAVLALVLAPAEVTCGARRMLPALAYALIFAAMFLKVLTTWRVCDRKGGLVRPGPLVLRALALAAPQVLISAGWLALVPPSVHRVGPASWQCYSLHAASQAPHLLLSLAYTCLLMVATAVLALLCSSKEELLEEGTMLRQESRWILVSAVAVAVQLGCWGLAVVAAPLAEVTDMLAASVHALTAATLLLCLFLPKLRLYLRLRRDARNTAAIAASAAARSAVARSQPIYGISHFQPFGGKLNPAFDAPSTDMSLGESASRSASDHGSHSGSDVEGDIHYRDPLERLERLEPLDPLERLERLDPTQVVPSSLYSIDMFSSQDSGSQVPPPGPVIVAMATGDGRGSSRGTLKGTLPHPHTHRHPSLFGTVRGGTLRSVQALVQGGTVRIPVRSARSQVRGPLHGTVRGPHFLPGSNEFTAPHRSSSMLLLPGQESISYM